MTREERLFFCKKCKNRDFHLSEGILCKLTGKKADFEESCPNYELDKERETKIQPSPTKSIRPNFERAKWAQNLIWVVLGVQIMSIISSYLQYELIHSLNTHEIITNNELEANDLREGIIGILYLAAYITSAIVFIQWFRRAYYNLSLRIKCQYTEGWAAGGWFVPFISLFYPYRIMSELQEKTTRLINQKSKHKIENNTGVIIGIWWTLWIISNFIGQYAFKAAMKSDTLESLEDSTIADMILGVIDIPMGILAVMLIASWSKKEEQLLELERKSSQLLSQG
jgi:hypothetical protein